MRIRKRNIKLKDLSSAPEVKKVKHLETSSVDSDLSERNTNKDTEYIELEDYSCHYEEDTMQGLFFIVRGQYRKGEAPHVKVEGVDGERVIDLGGYDPTTPITEPWQRWYMVLDKVAFHCIYSGSSLEKALEAVTKCMKHFRSPKRYFKEVCNVTSEDWYEVHYLGRKPLSKEGINKKAEGKCPRTSPIMKDLYKTVYLKYGDYFSDPVREVEEITLKEIEKWETKKESRKRKKIRLRTI